MRLIPLCLMAVCLWGLGSSAAEASSKSRYTFGSGGTIFCTPDSISAPGQSHAYVDNPIAAALRLAEPGTRIQLSGGDYPAFSIGLGSRSKSNADTRGGRSGQPVVIEGGPNVRILGKYDTIAISASVLPAYITFRRLTIVPGSRAGVIFYKNSGAAYRGFSFEDVHILGKFNHATGRGKTAKWGVKAHNLANFKFIGKRAPARIENIAVEHAFYLQNHLGPILIERVHAKNLGRTFAQFTARSKEGPPGKGGITIRNCEVQDACIGRGDAYKGGSAFTFSGRLNCRILLENNIYRAGFDKSLHKLTRKGAPYGTGAVAAWTEKYKERNGKLVLRDNHFSMAKDCGDRALVAIGGCAEVSIVGANVFIAGGKFEALALDPVYLNGKKISPANGPMLVARSTKIKGRVSVAGKQAGPERMLELSRRK
jgi:hypothetical protein